MDTGPRAHHGEGLRTRKETQRGDGGSGALLGGQGGRGGGGGSLGRSFYRTEVPPRNGPPGGPTVTAGFGDAPPPETPVSDLFLLFGRGEKKREKKVVLRRAGRLAPREGKVNLFSRFPGRQRQKAGAKKKKTGW